jgi:hypothetical protein
MASFNHFHRVCLYLKRKKKKEKEKDLSRQKERETTERSGHMRQQLTAQQRHETHNLHFVKMVWFSEAEISLFCGN